MAVVGAGVSGLTAAYLLRGSHDVTLFERESRLGGHAHTHDVPVPSGSLPVDSGFIVLNDRTYPLLRRLFTELGVHIKPTEMSMGIACDGCGLAYVGGRGPAGIFAQRSRVVDGRFWRLLRDIRRFQRIALATLTSHRDSLETYGDFLARHGFGADFIAHYALPVVACVWSSGQADALRYPAGYLFEFLSHHGFLRCGDAPQWYVVEGGSRAYVDALASRLDVVHENRAVKAVTRKADRVVLEDASGILHEFDKVVVATHADEALALLTDASEDEFDVLGAFGYTTNRTQLHRDDTVLPTRLGERASWNFRLADCAQRSDTVQVSYWMNRLQGHPGDHPLIVTLNAADRVDPVSVIAEMTYTHPLFTPASVAVQRRLGSLNTERTAFAGAYHGWGFHEDGCRSGVAAAEHFGVSW
ncbi:MAG: NAD(P)/FAD-dependent oxidoreductase [Nocardioidaceae bacterium]